MSTYKDFLLSWNLSHFQFILLLIILFLIGSLVMLLYKLGYLTPIRFKQFTLP